LLLSVATAYLTLWLVTRVSAEAPGNFSLQRLGVAVAVGLALVGADLFDLQASSFSTALRDSGGIAIDHTWAALGISTTAIAMLVVTLVIAQFAARMVVRNAEHARSIARATADLEYRHSHDALTSLHNHEAFMQQLRAAMAEADAAGNSLAVLVLDVDRLAVINDSAGHQAGDLLLTLVATRLQAEVRNQDLVARSGGDEFLVLLRRVAGTDEVTQASTRLLEAMRESFLMQGTELFATASIGASLYPEHALVAEELVSHADEAMHRAKREGRNRLNIFDREHHVYTPARLHLETELRHAVALGQLELHYQPQVTLSSGEITGLEALIRWRHPVLGMIPPDRFIPLAEESGLIDDIGDWVLAESCRQICAWREAGHPDLRVAINLSASQFRQAELAPRIAAVLAAHGVRAQQLEVELTESTVMTNVEDSVRTLEQLRRLGVLIAVDDFGTGYSSLSYLKRLPISRLKIDRSFVSDLGASNEGDSIAQSIVALGHGLRLGVIAEGVETVEQLRALRGMGCDEYQGYLCSRPLPAADVMPMVRDWQFVQRRRSRATVPLAVAS
jgi:diguanylate cyclase (GGDEF)-like protein